MSVILTCNTGSHNTKLAAFDSKTLERKGHAVTHTAAETLEWVCAVGEYDIVGIGHRIVHGGRAFTQPTLLADPILAQLETFIPLAPLHQPVALHLVAETRKLYPNAPHYACFDSAFHHTLPEQERRLPLPRRYHQQGVARYGFHGLSYQHIAETLPAYAGVKALGRVIAVHLGGGASACAMKQLESVATTMGFSTLDGLMMGTRCGALDAGVVLHCLKHLNMTAEAVEHLLYQESGLLGVSGISADMRELLASPQPEAREAVALYCHLATRQIASLLPTLGGLDALVFTGGIGENSAEIRDSITEGLRFAGNFPVYTIPAEEARVIAAAYRLLAA